MRFNHILLSILLSASSAPDSMAAPQSETPKPTETDGDVEEPTHPIADSLSEEVRSAPPQTISEEVSTLKREIAQLRLRLSTIERHSPEKDTASSESQIDSSQSNGKLVVDFTNLNLGIALTSVGSSFVVGGALSLLGGASQIGYAFTLSGEPQSAFLVSGGVTIAAGLFSFIGGFFVYSLGGSVVQSSFVGGSNE